jgi:esterase/lipase superfamily enzyme
MLQVKDCIPFLRRYKMLDNWTDAQIAVTIHKSIKHNLFGYMMNGNHLTGICFGKYKYTKDNLRHRKCYIHIIAIAGVFGTLKAMIRYLKATHPEVEILTAFRKKKKFVSYSIERL